MDTVPPPSCVPVDSSSSSDSANAGGCHPCTAPVPAPYPACVRLNETMSVLSPSCQHALKGMGLGQEIRQCCFNLESTTTFLNHGSYGAAPTPVLSAQAYYVNRTEMNPDRFMIRERPEFLKRTRRELSQFVGANEDDIVLVSNATTGVNAVLRSLDLQDGDEVICLNLAYPAIINTLRHICYYTQEFIDLKVIDVELPVSSYDDLILQITKAITDKTRLAVFDHITSGTGFVLPIDALVRVCHAHDIPVLVDGAHAPGQLALNLNSLNADFYVGNCYKWLFASKGCAFLHVSKSQQVNVRPVVTSLGCDQGFVEDFSTQGTRDEANFLTLPTAIDMFKSIGIDRIATYNSNLINWASEYLAAQWSTEALLPPWQRAPFMSCIRLPLDFPQIPGKTLTTENMLSICNRVAEIVLDKCNIVIKVTPVQGKMYVRISAHVYNERQDYIKLGNTIQRLTNCPSLLAHFENLKLKD